MFDDFSFAWPSRHYASCHPYRMHDSVSPTSSRESTPSYNDDYNGSSDRAYPITPSIAELSQHFDRHTLTPRRPSICLDESKPRARELNPPHRSPASFANRVCRRRQTLNRLQCSSDRHLSRISALVEEMVQTGRPLYEPTHPTALLDDSSSPSLSPEEIPPMTTPMTSYFDLPSSRPSSFKPSSSFSAPYNSRLPQHPLRHAHSYRIDKNSRFHASKQGIGKPMVKKKIRMRKSLKTLENEAKTC